MNKDLSLPSFWKTLDHRDFLPDFFKLFILLVLKVFRFIVTLYFDK